MGGFGVAVRAEFAHRALSRDCTANVARVFRPEAVRLLLVFWMSPPRAIFSPRHGDESEKTSASCKSQKARGEIPKNRSGGAFENCSESKGWRNRSKTRSQNSRKIGRSLSRRNLRTETRQSLPIVDFHDPISAMHRRARQSSHCHALPEIPNAGSLRLRYSQGTRAGHPPNWIFPQQDQIDHGRQQKNRRRIRRRGAEDDGPTLDAAGRGAKDGERRPGLRLRNCLRRRGGYACATPLAPPRPNRERRPQENRAGPNENHPAGPLDSLLASIDLARPPRMPGAQAALHRLQSRKNLLLRR